MNGDTPALITNGRIANLSGMNLPLDTCSVMNLNSSDTNNTIGSVNATDGVEIKGFNNVKMFTSVANKPILNVGQSGISCKGKLLGQTLTNATERDLIDMTSTTAITIGDTNCELAVKGTKTLFGSGNELEVNDYIKFLTATTSSYIKNSTGTDLLSRNTLGDLINIFGNDTDKTHLRGSNIEMLSLVGEMKLDGTYIEFDSTQEILVKSADINLFESAENVFALPSGDTTLVMDSSKLQLTMDNIVLSINDGTEVLNVTPGLTSMYDDLTLTFSDLRLNGDLFGTDCDVNIDGDVKIALLSKLNLDRNNTTTIFNYMRANTAVQLNNALDESAGQAGGTEIFGYQAVLLSQTNNPSVNNAELWVHGNRVNVSATTFNYPTGGGSGSDDRIKFNEIPVQFDCLALINSLQVEVYDKHFIKDKDRFMDREMGIIAQDTYNKIKNQVDSDTADLFVSEIDYTIPTNFTENGDIYS